MPLKFAANISTMFREAEQMPDRYKLAKSCGFHYVECQFPYSFPEGDLKKAREESHTKHVLINSFPGKDHKEFGYGLLSPEIFNKSIDTTLKYAEALHCDRVHIMSGHMEEKISESAMEDIFVENLKYATALFAKKNITCLVEPICPQVKENYFMHSFSRAVRCIEKVNNPNLKLLLDIYHLQMLLGNLTNNIISYFPYIGHVQISQAPNRNEPNASGEINYDYVLHLLDTLGYNGFVGLEYFPTGGTRDSLSWIKEYGYDDNNLTFTL